MPRRARAICGDAQDGPFHHGRHVVNQLLEPRAEKYFATQEIQHGEVGVEPGQFAAQFQANAGRSEQAVAILRLITVDAAKIAAIA